MTRPRRTAPLLACLLCCVCSQSPAADKPEPLLPRHSHYRQKDESTVKAKRAWRDITKVVGRKAPEIRATTWRGKSTSIKANKGKIIVLDFWATWCGPCIRAFPENKKLIKEFKDDVVFIGLCHPNGADKLNRVAGQHKLRYPIAVDKNKRNAGAYSVGWYPYYVVIDQKSVIRDAGVYPSRVRKAVKELLKEARASEMLEESGDAAIEQYLTGNRNMRLLYNEMHDKPAHPLPEGEWIVGQPTPPNEQRGKVVLLEISFLGNREGENYLKLETNEKLLNPIAARYDPNDLAVISVVKTNGAYKAEPYMSEHETEYPQYLLADNARLEGYNYFGRAIYHVIDRDGRFFAAGVKPRHLTKVIDLALEQPASPTPEPISDPNREQDAPTTE